MSHAASELNGNGVIDLDDNTIPLFTREDVPPGDFDFFGDSKDGEIIDGEIVDDGTETTLHIPETGSRIKSETPEPMDRNASSGVPKIDEWMHFFSKVCLRLATDFYIDYAFRDIDEESLTDREVERIKLTDVERDRMARPFAEYSNKSKFMRKHGRMIIASADSIDAIIQMGMWFSRVNRIAAKYKGTRKTRAPRVQPVRSAPIFRAPRAPQPQEDFTDRSEDNVSAGQGAPQQRGDHWRPDIAGTVFNPSGGG